MKKIGLALLLMLASVGLSQAELFFTPADLQVALLADNRGVKRESPASFAHYNQRHHQQQITDSGRVIRLLADDNKGSRHQRFILRLANNQTLLVAHNIDLAPYLYGLKVGDTVSFSGEYIWNNKGGILHWTHHDPKGRHPGGWLKYNGELYQ